MTLTCWLHVSYTYATYKPHTSCHDDGEGFDYIDGVDFLPIAPHIETMTSDLIPAE